MVVFPPKTRYVLKQEEQGLIKEALLASDE